MQRNLKYWFLNKMSRIIVDIIRLWGVGPIDCRISISLKNKLRIHEIEFNI